MARRESDYSRPTVRRRGMRTGYTTGACAAAAAKAATLALLMGEPQREVTIRLPIGKDATFQIERCEIKSDDVIFRNIVNGTDTTTSTALCSVIKDGGDDPDVTSGAEICARVWTDDTVSRVDSTSGESGVGFNRSVNGASGADEVSVTLRGGEGVGTVTKPGTGIDVGDASITRVPRRMITQSVQNAAKSMGGAGSFIVEISVPGGHEIAKKTDNPRLGIVDGISILGTTGVVQPFSTAAWRASVNVAINVAAANNLAHMVITTGTQSELFAKRWLALEDMAYVNVGIFTGSALERCVRNGIPRATLVGMVGKFSKIAMGYFVTHVAGNKVDPAFLASLAAECGASDDVQALMRDAASGRHFQEIALEHGAMQVFDLMCERVCDEARRYLNGKMHARDADLRERANDLIIDAICFDFEGDILGKASTSAAGIPLTAASDG
ncbi:MAG: cobalamin biosynthesis protein CbiD [Chloroflexi bacterium]|nr:cobalamin biosynthesis protein CbiD [Chloroflexota bacterium]